MSDRMTVRKQGVLISLPVAASTKIEGGKMVAVNTSGYAVEASDTAGLRVVGIADGVADNSSGSAGDKRVNFWAGQLFLLNNSATNAVDVADAGSRVFVEDDETVADAAGTNGIVAGLCVEVVSNGVWVQIPGGFHQVATQAASVAADVAALKTDFNALLTKLQAAGIMHKA